MEKTIKNIILLESEQGSFQPKFQVCNNLYEVTDDMLKPHEDYHLNLHESVVNIICNEINYSYTTPDYTITFNDACNIQKVLFNDKLDIIEKTGIGVDLPNLHINTGLRQNIVKVGDWTPPMPYQLPDLIELSFPVKLKNNWDLNTITEWYKIFEICHFFEDLNGRVGGIIINIISKLTMDCYLKRVM